MSGKSSKRFGISLLLLLSVCCSLSAFPNRAKRSGQEAQIPTVTEVAVTAVEIEPENVETELTESLGTNDAVQKYEEMLSIKGEDKAELLALYEAEYLDHMEAEDEILRLADRVDELEALNAKQADAIARETGNKAYVRATSSVGFEEGWGNPSFWLGGAVGARIGNGLLFDVGAEYRIGSLSDFTPKSGFENMRLNASIGWEW